MTAHEIFKANRLTLNLTQVELAKILRLSERQVARYETGQSDPPGAVLAVLDGLLGKGWPRLTAQQKLRTVQKRKP